MNIFNPKKGAHMRKKWTYFLIASLAVMALCCSCGDDDECPTCPGITKPLGFTNGSLFLDPEAYMYDMRIYGYGAVPPNVDSVIIGDSSVHVDDIDYDYEYEYEDAFWEIYFDEDGSEATYMYDHGDTAVVKVYGEGRSSTCHLVILDADSAEAEIISPDYDDDTVSNTESVTVHWNSVELVDYYAILLEFRDSPNGQSDWYYMFDYTLDTFYTVTPDMYPDSLRYFYVNVTPFTGPDPRTGNTNWTGNLLAGRLYSFGWDDYTRIQGWNQPVIIRTTGKIAVEERKQWTPEEIVQGVYDRFK